MIERSPEDEAFDEIERKQLLAVRTLARSRTAQESLDEWGHSHRPEQVSVAREQFHEHMTGSFYTPPPQRPWVGLTGQEKAWIASVSLDVHDAVHRTEARLKDKNA